jgi:hypothetical protein
MVPPGSFDLVAGLFSGVLEPRTRTLRQIKAAIVHMEDLATFTANIDGRVKGAVALTAISPITPATIPNTTRSPQNRDLYAIDRMAKTKSG